MSLTQFGQSYLEQMAAKRGMTLAEFIALGDAPLEAAEPAPEAKTKPKEKTKIIKESAPKKEEEFIAPVLYLRPWPEDQRCAPNAILRSALFGVVAKGKREGVENRKIVAWGEDSIFFSGLQLCQFDCTVWLQSLHYAREQQLGNKIYFSLREFIKAIGLSVSGQNSEMLKRSFDRLQTAVLRLDTKRTGYSGHLIDKVCEDKDSGKWCMLFNMDLFPLFAYETTWINWEIRKSLKGPLAQWLMNWVCTHTATPEKPQKIGILKLQTLCGSSDQAKRSFKQNLIKAIKQLHEKGVVQSWMIEAEVLSMVRPRKVKE